MILNNSTGAAATLAFVPNASIVTGVPSNVNFGIFALACPTSSTLAGGIGSTFSPFTFDLIITDITDGATGKLTGTSTGGMAPLQLGPRTNNAMSGSFGPTSFTTTVFTGIVAPNSGTDVGQSTVQGFVSSVPESATLSLIGGALSGLGLLRRKRNRGPGMPGACRNASL